MSDDVTEEEIADKLKLWLRETASYEDATFDRVIDLVARGCSRASRSAPLLERISIELLAQIWPVVIEELSNERFESQHKLIQMQEIVHTIQRDAELESRRDLAVISAFRQVSEVPREVEELYEQYYMSESSILSVYRQYLELGYVSVTLERLLLLGSIAATLQERIHELRPNVVAAKMALPDWGAFLWLTGGAMVVAFFGARIWAWFELGNVNLSYWTGWVLGRMIIIFVPLAVLAAIVTARVWVATVRRSGEGRDAVGAFKRSALMRMHSEATRTTATQARLLELLELSEREGVALADPGRALLLRATARSPDDWLTA